MQITRRKFLHNTGIVIAGAALAGTIAGCAAEAGIPRHKALIVPPGPEVKPVKVDKWHDGWARCYDLNGNGIIEYVDFGDMRAYSFMEDLLGNRMGFGWEGETRAGGTEFLDHKDAVIRDSPENIWIAEFRTDSFGSEYTDLLTGKETPVTIEMAAKVVKAYEKRRPHASPLGYKWIAEYEGKERLAYPIGSEKTLGHWPMTLKDWKEIKAKGPVLIEYW